MIAYTSYSDTELTDLLRSRDSMAYTEIYHRYWRLLYGHIFKMLRDEEESKDILQELFSSLWTKADKIPEQHNLAGYLYVVARNLVLNSIRQRKFWSDYLSSIAAFANEASEATLHHLEERDLLAALLRLPLATITRLRPTITSSQQYIPGK